MGTHLLVAWLTAGQDAGLHGHLAEVLQLTVDVQVPDAAVEAGAILARGLAQGRSHIVLPGHACRGTSGQWSATWGFLSHLPPRPFQLFLQGGSQSDTSLGQLAVCFSTCLHVRITQGL